MAYARTSEISVNAKFAEIVIGKVQLLKTLRHQGEFPTDWKIQHISISATGRAGALRYGRPGSTD
jgi:hypothetical protein